MSDLISRQAVIESLKNEYNRKASESGWDRSFGLKLAWIEKAVDGVPAAEMEIKRWTPCGERLPETEDKVLCCTMTKKGIPNIVIGYCYVDGGGKRSWACGMNSNVIAWMPLPEPWKGEKNAND